MLTVNRKLYKYKWFLILEAQYNFEEVNYKFIQHVGKTTNSKKMNSRASRITLPK